MKTFNAASSAAAVAMTASASNPANQDWANATTIPAPTVNDAAGSVAYTRALYGPDGSDQSALLASTSTASTTVNYASSTVWPGGVWRSELSINDGTTTVIVVQVWRIGDERGYLTLDPTVGAKSDPNGMENSAPTLVGGKWRFSYDASTAYTAASDTLAYMVDIPVVAWGSELELHVEVEAANSSSARGLVAAIVSDLTTGFSAGNGAWAGLSDENGSDQWDYWVRPITTNAPNTGSGSDPAPRLATTFRAGGSQLRPAAVMYAGSTFIAGFSNDFCIAPTSGTVRVGYAVTNRSSATATETIDAVIKIRAANP